MRNYGEACQGYDRVVSEDPSLTVYCPDKYITQRISDEAVDVSLAESKLIPDWFVASKMLEKLYTALFTDENTFYFNKILLMLHFVMMKWVFLMKVLIILILIIILMRMILMLLFLSDFWLGILDLKNAKYLKKR